MRWLAIAGALAALLATGCGDDPSADARRGHLERAYRAGVEQARQDIAAGRAVLYVDERRAGGTLRIDRETGLPLRIADAPCGTGVDTEAAQMGIAGYQAEIARARAAGELRASSLAAKVPDEAALRARFDAEDAVVLDTAEGSLTPPGGALLNWRTAPYDDVLVAFDLVDPASADGASLPFNRRPLRILWDHEGTTLVALGPDGTLATVDVPSRTWIAVFPAH